MNTLNIHSVIRYHCATEWNWELPAGKQSDWNLWVVEEGLGSGSLQTHEFHLRPGTMLLIPPGTAGRMQHDPAHPLVVTACHFDQSMDSFVLQVHQHEALPILKHQLQQLLAAWNLRDTPACTSWLHCLLWDLQNALKLNPTSARPPAHEAVISLIGEIARQPEQSLSVPELASRCFISQQHLCRLFHEWVGCGPLQYLLRCRVQKAQEALAGDSQPMSQIADQWGWKDQASFSRCFQRITGMSPRKFRSLTQGKSLSASTLR